MSSRRSKRMRSLPKPANSVRALDNPSMTPQALLALDTFARDARGDTPSSQVVSASAAVVTLVSVQFVGPLTRPAIQTGHSGNRIQCRLEGHRIMAIGARHRDRQRHTLRVYDEVPLAAEFAPVRRIRAGFLAPRGLATLAPSMLARPQSIWSCSRKRRNIATCSWSHAPAACQSRNRLQQVMLLPKPSSWGKSSQGMPVCSTYTIPFNAARSSTERRRPPLSDGTNSGINGSRTAHNSLLIYLLAMRGTIQATARRVQLR
jgi:hypothetical protein